MLVFFLFCTELVSEKDVLKELIISCCIRLNLIQNRKMNKRRYAVCFILKRRQAVGKGRRMK